jgi:hypothetical protein
VGKDQLLRINRGAKQMRKLDNIVRMSPMSASAPSLYEMEKLLQFLSRKYDGLLWTHPRNSSLPLVMFRSNIGSSFDVNFIPWRNQITILLLSLYFKTSSLRIGSSGQESEGAITQFRKENNP